MLCAHQRMSHWTAQQHHMCANMSTVHAALSYSVMKGPKDSRCLSSLGLHPGGFK